jgi:ATP-dependent helicase HrpB
MHRLPLHPRLARVLLSAGGGPRAAAACAVLGEGWRPVVSGDVPTTDSDVLSAADRLSEAPPGVRSAARELERLVPGVRSGRLVAPDDRLLEALLAGFPDRVAKRREPGSPRLLLASGHGAILGAESGVGGGEYLVAVDVQAGRRGETAEARVRVASIVERSWLAPTDTARDHELGDDGAVRAVERDRYGALVLGERVVAPDPAIAARLLADAFVARGVSAADEQLLRRLRFAGIEVDVRDLARRAAEGCRRLDELDLERALERAVRRDLDRLAPPHLAVPSGGVHGLEYREDGTVVAAVKLQELFGLAETPRIGRRREPVLLALLAPNGRPVQMTRDLASFWRNTYPEVRRELRGRYPRHPWPEDPWSARPTARTKGRS